jgi:hypothetical protein
MSNVRPHSPRQSSSLQSHANAFSNSCILPCRCSHGASLLRSRRRRGTLLPQFGSRRPSAYVRRLLRGSVRSSLRNHWRSYVSSTLAILELFASPLHHQNLANALVLINSIDAGSSSFRSSASAHHATASALGRSLPLRPTIDSACLCSPSTASPCNTSVVGASARCGLTLPSRGCLKGCAF